MTSFEKFLDENYEITVEEFESLSEYEKRLIDREYDSYWRDKLKDY